MNKPLITIIVPVYNVEKYLSECVDSILAQNSNNWELILIDDGSPDNCPQICDEYANRNECIKVIHQQNQGVAVARNAGLNIALGEWIWFVDSDDVINPNIVYPHELPNLQNIDFIINDLYTFENEINTASLPTTSNTISIVYSHDKNEFLLKYICAYHQILWYRKDIIEKYNIRFTPGLKVGEDGEFQYKYLMVCSNLIKLEQTTYYYRLRKGSESHNELSRQRNVNASLVVMTNLLKFIIENKVILEPWLLNRIEGILKNYLYSVSCVKGISLSKAQNDYRAIVQKYKNAGYNILINKKYELAYFNIRLYISLNQVYLNIKSRINNKKGL